MHTCTHAHMHTHTHTHTPAVWGSTKGNRWGTTKKGNSRVSLVLDNESLIFSEKTISGIIPCELFYGAKIV